MNQKTVNRKYSNVPVKQVLSRMSTSPANFKSKSVLAVDSGKAQSGVLSQRQEVRITPSHVGVIYSPGSDSGLCSLSAV